MTHGHCCYACGQLLPVRAPRGGESAAQWDTGLLAQLEYDLGRESDGYRAIWTLIRDPKLVSARAWSRALGLSGTELPNRWYRGGLPSPKRYVTAVRLIRAAALWEQHDLTVSEIAYRLEWSSPQALCRHVQTELGYTVTGARVRYTSADLVQQFREVFVLRHLDVLRHKPLLAPDLAAERRRRARAQAVQQSLCDVEVAA